MRSKLEAKPTVKMLFHQDKVIYKYEEENLYQYEKYPQRFTNLIDCLTWGKAMDSAVKKRWDALEKIKALETHKTIVSE